MRARVTLQLSPLITRTARQLHACTIAFSCADLLSFKAFTGPNILCLSPVTTALAQDGVVQLGLNVVISRELVGSSEGLPRKAFLQFGVRGGHEVNEKSKRAKD